MSSCIDTAVTGRGSSSPVIAPLYEGGRVSPRAKSGDLLYLSDAQSKVYVYSYPQGALVTTITGLDAPGGECADASGNIWITLYRADEIVEYAHGGTQPIATLDDPGPPSGCAVDPSSGNLAVANASGSIAVYSNAKGTPATYSSSDFPTYYYCTYDSAGDLFADSGNGSGVIAELPHGTSELETIKLNKDIQTFSMQWDGSDISIAGSIVDGIPKKGEAGNWGPLELNRVSVAGSIGTIVSQTALESPGGKHNGRHVIPAVQFWINGNGKAIIGPGFYPQGKEGALTWRYPSGGRPISKIRASWGPWGTTLSRAN